MFFAKNMLSTLLSATMLLSGSENLCHLLNPSESCLTNNAIQSESASISALLSTTAEEVLPEIKDTESENPENEYTEITQTDGETVDAVSISAPSAILIEASTGTVIYEKNAHESMRPASITKIMTLILIFEALEKGQFTLTDIVTVSEHAASMGGSQVYLEAGEEQTVEDLIKCISIASANDACVAMAEYVAGSEDAFVQKMNEKASELGMEDTNFVNCCGLEAEGHLTSAYDIALMSRELTLNHPEIFTYCQIWMDTIIHHTSKGDSEFDLTNTNKLLRYYSYTTGLKTGYTSQSKYCLSATATRGDVDLIAVVMAEETPTVRNSDAVALLDYGFSVCRVYEDTNTDVLPSLTVTKGTEMTVPLIYEDSFTYILLDGSAADTITKTINLPEEIPAPVAQGDVIGYAAYWKDGTEIGAVPILADADISLLTISDCFLRSLQAFFML